MSRACPRSWCLTLSPFATLLQLLDLALHQLTFECTHLVEKDNAVAVISFVKHAACGEFSLIQFKLIAVDVMRANDRAQAALNRREDPGKRKTALFAFCSPST